VRLRLANGMVGKGKNRGGGAEVFKNVLMRLQPSVFTVILKMVNTQL
jgi:hypothetical protein